MTPVAIVVMALGLNFFSISLAANHKHHAVIKLTKKTEHRPVATPKPVTVAAQPPSTKPPASDTSSASSQPTPTPKPRPKPVTVVTTSPGSSVSNLSPSSSPPANPPANQNSPSPVSYTSTNWSGYLMASGNYTSVSGNWLATSPTGNGSSTSADATWIGIGGVSTNDLIQVGTENTVSAGGQVTSSAFFELLPSVSQPVPGVSVSPGDLMSAVITEISSSSWSISITDQANGQNYTSDVSYASSNSSAEWVEEDPSYVSGRQIPFDFFGSTSFSAAAATASGSPANLIAGQASKITMVNQADQPIATPSAIGGDNASFTVTRDNP